MHLIPQGVPADKVLILSGILQSRAEKVVFIRNSQPKLPNTEKMAQRCLEDVVTEVNNNRSIYWFVKEMDTKTCQVDFFNILNCLGKLHALIQKETRRGNEVSVNASTGNKIVSFALSMAALRNRAEIFYFVPKDIDVQDVSKLAVMCEEGYLSKEPSECVTINPFPIDYMNRVPFDVLMIVEKLGGVVPSYTELASYMYPRITDKRMMKSKRVEISGKIRILEDMSYVRTIKSGNSRQINLTDLGRQALEFVRSQNNQR